MELFNLNKSFKGFLEKLNRADKNISYDRRSDMKVAFIAGATLTLQYLKDQLEKGYENKDVEALISSLSKEMILSPTDL